MTTRRKSILAVAALLAAGLAAGTTCIIVSRLRLPAHEYGATGVPESPGGPGSGGPGRYLLWLGDRPECRLCQSRLDVDRLAPGAQRAIIFSRVDLDRADFDRFSNDHILHAIGLGGEKPTRAALEGVVAIPGLRALHIGQLPSDEVLEVLRGNPSVEEIQVGDDKWTHTMFDVFASMKNLRFLSLCMDDSDELEQFKRQRPDVVVWLTN